MRAHVLLAALYLAAPAAQADPGAVVRGYAAAKGSKEQCQRGCNSRCHGARNKSKCVNMCRRACR